MVQTFTLGDTLIGHIMHAHVHMQFYAIVHVHVPMYVTNKRERKVHETSHITEQGGVQ